MVRTLILKLLVLLCFSGCSIMASKDKEPVVGQFYQPAEFAHTRSNQHKTVDSYIRDIVSDLKENIKSYDVEGVIAVTHFGEVDSNYTSTNYLGLAVGESFVHQLHMFGFNAIDFKVADYIRVTPEGDFILSRDFLELRQKISVNYVLVGSLVDQGDGHQINARIVDIHSKAILASGQTFIPQHELNRFSNRSYISAR